MGRERITNKICYLDLETTGLNPVRNGIHQIAGIIEIAGEVKERFDIRLQPRKGSLIDTGVLEKSGVTERDIMRYMPTKKGLETFIGVLDTYIDIYDKYDKFFLCGYNVGPFDSIFIRELFARMQFKSYPGYFYPGTLDVMVLAAQYYSEYSNMPPNFKLHTICRDFNIPIDTDQLHNAAYDIGRTRLLHKQLTYIHNDLL